MAEVDKDSPIGQDAIIADLEMENKILIKRLQTLNAAMDLAEKKIKDLKEKVESLQKEKDDALEALLLAMSEFAKYKKSR